MKGSVFEREICKALGRWWTDGERDTVCIDVSTNEGCLLDEKG